MVTIHPTNLRRAWADTLATAYSPSPRRFRAWKCCLVFLKLAWPFAGVQIWSCSPAAGSARWYPQTGPWTEGPWWGYSSICADTASRGLTHVPDLSASRCSVATQGRRGPLYTAPSPRTDGGQEERGRKGSSMESGQRASLEPSPHEG